MKTITPATGWYADPTDATAERWWSGRAWSTYTRPGGDGSPRLPIDAPVLPAGLQQTPAAPMRFADKERAVRRANPIAYLGVVLALFALIFNVFAIPGLLAVVFSAIGLGMAARLRRQGVRYSGTVAASIGLALGLLVNASLVLIVVQRLSAAGVL